MVLPESLWLLARTPNQPGKAIDAILHQLAMDGLVSDDPKDHVLAGYFMDLIGRWSVPEQDDEQDDDQ